ncbi:hypothetical protein SPRG_04569 [Saprolegnia parasitica CBS 223.65]|uniref:TKL protein kinase n=1 Tax=Saprolegnia parasitica (strain CBS 223.65) TaxID=695850 RepID=A0A067CJK0_SAPPC|nr:hypothetical protein SPRG_04569 [Saprolegnia parasitica CBS 223.65]KDO30668.1 hypothetical protein SPRG_04569 [Saprolegnia parasitica CBS 223.65]|eukprot:XP_012198372.1 hypothetical protein SPRG_04569 [Saprolegnia parasitica CBS 223.65]
MKSNHNLNHVLVSIVQYTAAAKDPEVFLAALPASAPTSWALSPPCRFSQYATTATTDCAPLYGLSYCIVDKNCKIVKEYDTDAFRLDSVVDNLGMTLEIVNVSVEHVADLPAKVPNLAIAFKNAAVKSLGDFSSASNVTGFLIEYNNATLDVSSVVWPRSLQTLVISNAGLRSVPKLTAVPKLTTLTLAANEIETLQDLDLRSVLYMDFAVNPVTTVYNISLGTDVRSLVLDGDKLTTFTVDPATYRVLQARTPLRSHLAHAIHATCSLPNTRREVNTTYPFATTESMSTICVTPQSMLPPSRMAGVSGAAVGGIVIATVSLLSAIGFAFFKRRRNRATSSKHDEYKDVSATDDASDPGDNAAIPADLSMLRLDTALLQAIDYVAEGAYGQVWRGTYQGDTVAIKRLLPGKASRVALANLAEEILLASTMQSPYIVQLLGASWRTPSDLQMVLEWMDRGDLRSAPEVLYDCYYSTAADVYAFGVVISELSTHEIPYYDLRTEKGLLLLDTAIMGRVMTGAISPTFGKSTPSWVLALGKADARPTERNPPSPDDAATKRGTKRSTHDEAMDAKRLCAQIRAASRLFQCPVCLDTFAGAVVECNACAQVFCEACLTACLVRQSGRCPLCRCDPTPTRRNKPVERLVAMLPTHCPFELDSALLTRSRARRPHCTPPI